MDGWRGGVDESERPTACDREAHQKDDWMRGACLPPSFALRRVSHSSYEPRVPMPTQSPLSPSRRIRPVVWACASLAGLGIADAIGAEGGLRFRKSSPELRPMASPESDAAHGLAEPPRSPSGFNPDPGMWDQPAQKTDPHSLLLFPEESVMPGTLKLPRGNVIGHDPIKKTFTYPSYPLGREGLGLLPHAKGVPNRWLIPFPHWQRYRDMSTETPYMYDTPRLWHPYRQSKLKGDVPVFGQDIFFNLTAKNFSLFEMRKLPVPSGVSTAFPNSAEFFGRGDQMTYSNDASIAFDLFKGETAFKPVQWLIRVNAVYNSNWTRVRENNLLFPLGSQYPSNYVPNTATIGAIPASPTGVNVQSGNPGRFTTTVNPADFYNYIAPQLQPLAGARPLVQVDPNTGRVPPGTSLPAPVAGGDLSGMRYTTRFRDHFALQEAFVELHIGDVSENYDFISSRIGTQPFISDFRGFIFADTNLGVRIFGNHDNNRTQYNFAYFNMREKHTYSGLNTLASRDQHVFIANAFRQDFGFKGYTAQASLHLNLDRGGVHYDRNGFLTRPQILGTVPDASPVSIADNGLRKHDVKSFYLGWTGDGHIGRWNLTHAFYQVFGEDEFNSLAGKRVDINAQMAALEVSYDRDWFRLKLSGFYASGDSRPTDRTGHGFDTILDNPSFVGGPFSWYVHEGINLPGTGMNLKQADSLVMNLRSSKIEGQSNFVNPGALILGFGLDMDVTPKLKAFTNVNYIWMVEPASIKAALQTDRIRNDLGLDASFGFKYRPFLTDNIIVSLGMGFFFPGGGYRDMYRSNTMPVPGFGPQSDSVKPDSMLYNAFFTVSLVY